MAPPIFTIFNARQKFKLRDIESGNARPASDFKLIGSGQIAEGVTDPLADIRAEQRTLSEKKLASFGN
jgi:hypothetical protein